MIEHVVNKYLEAWSATFSLFRRPLLLVPFLVIALLKLIPVVLACFFWHPSVSGFAVPAIESIWGEDALHFQTHVLGLPGMFNAINSAVMIVVGFMLIGWAVLMMRDTLQGRPSRRAGHAGELVVYIPSFFVIGFVFVGGTIGIPLLLSKLGDFVARPRLQMLLGLSAVGFSLWLQTLLVYSPYFLRESAGRAFAAIRQSIKHARSSFGLTAIVVLTAGIMILPLDFLIARSMLMMGISGMGLVFVVLLARIIVEMFALFYLFASTTYIASRKPEWS